MTEYPDAATFLMLLTDIALGTAKVLDLLGHQDGDEIVDIFPGTGVMGVVAGNTPMQDGLFAEVECSAVRGGVS